MRPSAALVVLVGFLLSGLAMAQDRTLFLPRPLQVHETAWIELEIGPIPHGATITVTTQAGEALGRIAPFGARAAQAGGSYSLPVPADAIRDDRVSVRLLISVPGGLPRPATAQEVTSVKLVAR